MSEKLVPLPDDMVQGSGVCSSIPACSITSSSSNNIIINSISTNIPAVHNVHDVPANVSAQSSHRLLPNRPSDLPDFRLIRPPRPSSAEGSLQSIVWLDPHSNNKVILHANVSISNCNSSNNNNNNDRDIDCIERLHAPIAMESAPFLFADCTKYNCTTVQSDRKDERQFFHRNKSYFDWRRSNSYSTSSPPSPTPSSLPSSFPSTRVSQEFNDWYQRLRIHSVYDFNDTSDDKIDGSRSSLKEWIRHQPLAVLQLDKVDRVVLKIAGTSLSLFHQHLHAMFAGWLSHVSVCLSLLFSCL